MQDARGEQGEGHGGQPVQAGPLGEPAADAAQAELEPGHEEQEAEADIGEEGDRLAHLGDVQRLRADEHAEHEQDRDLGDLRPRQDRHDERRQRRDRDDGEERAEPGATSTAAHGSGRWRPRRPRTLEPSRRRGAIGSAPAL